MHNRIEKSRNRHGEYVGYCDGVWHIKKNGDLWEARKADGRDFFRASSLDNIGKGLDERANLAVSHILFRGN